MRLLLLASCSGLALLSAFVRAGARPEHVVSGSAPANVHAAAQAGGTQSAAQADSLPQPEAPAQAESAQAVDDVVSIALGPERLAPELPAALLERAAALAREDYAPRTEPALPPALAEMDYDRYRRIDFDPDHSLWKGNGSFELQLFHRGYLYKAPVALRECVEGECAKVPYRPELFDLSAAEGLDAAALPADFGFAGFGVYAPTEQPGEFREVASFLGASYFRFCGAGESWGGSFRGLAIGTGKAGAEEFPAFVEHWIERPEPGAESLVIYSLLDSPSVAGAYALRLTPGDDVRADVALALYPRRKLEHLGLAPLTSMFFYGEDGARLAGDYRPEVHDSDGVAIAAGGRHLWRPLANPRAQHRVTRFEFDGAEGFGLLQRDRDFASYEDLESRYDRRPTLWVEPLGDWGPGAVELVEIPTNSEYNDNVVVLWSPDAKPKKGEEVRFNYSLLATSAAVGPRQRVVATRRARLSGGGVRFLVDYTGGGPLALDYALPRADFEGSEVPIELVAIQPNPAVVGWRVIFDVPEPPNKDARLVLRLAAPLAVPANGGGAPADASAPPATADSEPAEGVEAADADDEHGAENAAESARSEEWHYLLHAEERS